MTLLPEPTVRPAVAFHPVSPMGMMVAAVPGYCSTCARPAPAATSRTAAAHHATVRIKKPPIGPTENTVLSVAPHRKLAAGPVPLAIA